MIAKLLILAILPLSAACCCRDDGYGDLRDQIPKTTIDSWRDGKRCGPNSLYVLLKLAGRKISMNHVLEVLPPHDNGVSMRELEDASQQLGMPMVTLQLGSLGDIENFQSPFIAHLSGNREGHFLIVLGINESKELVTVADAISCEIQEYSVSEFRRQWSGFVLVSIAEYRWDQIYRVLRIVFIVLSLWICVLAVRLVRRGNHK